jgi:hypothetical protein
MWKIDTKEDIDVIVQNDINANFDPHLFMKDPNDVLNALEVVKQNFRMIQTTFMYMRAETYLNYESVFPEVNY